MHCYQKPRSSRRYSSWVLPIWLFRRLTCPISQSGQTQAAIDTLLSLEKQTRQASDLPSTSRLIVTLVTICKSSDDWSLLNEQVLLLSKKHGQLKQAITKMVQVVMGFLDEAPSMEVKLNVIETLRTVTEGKVRMDLHRCES